MNYQELNGHTIREGFNKFNMENPHIFQAFEKQVLKAIHNGKKKISAKMIINWIRWHEFLDSTDENFKINDAYQAYYARHFIEKYPEYNGIFELRKLRNEENSPYLKLDDNGQFIFL